MSDTELGLNKKIGKLCKDISNNLVDIIKLDLHRWNMLQRHESNYPISSILNNLFGLNFRYKESYLWMQRSYVISNSRVNPPKINELNGLPFPEKFCHVNQKGGFEGIKQKLWTITTLMIIKSVAAEMNLEIVIGQGDNVVIAIYW